MNEDKLAWQQAREAAEKALDLVRNPDGTITFPIKLEKILDAHEITLEKKFLVNGTSGYIHKPNDAEPPKIVVNFLDSSLRQRFTIAHEIGHFYDRLEAKDTTYSFIDERGRNYDLREFYADEFAGALLMPEKEIIDMVKKGTTLEKLSAYFEVSIPAVKQRLIRLKRTL